MKYASGLQYNYQNCVRKRARILYSPTDYSRITVSINREKREKKHAHFVREVNPPTTFADETYYMYLCTILFCSYSMFCSSSFIEPGPLDRGIILRWV